MHIYRTHNCAALRAGDVGKQVRLSGWVHRKRDHGNLLFIDLRDHYGVTQCVIDTSSPLFKAVESVRVEYVVTITGKVVPRPPETVNTKLATGEIEVQIDEFAVAVDRRGAAAAGRQRRGFRRGHPPALPLPRSPPREGPSQHRAALAA